MAQASIAAAAGQPARGWARVSPWVLDVALVLVLTAALLASRWPDRGSLLPWQGPNWATVIRLLPITLPLAGRRRWPLACYGLQLVGVVLGPHVLRSPVALLALVIGGYYAARVPGRRAGVLVAVGAVGAAVAMRIAGNPGTQVLVAVAVWLLGSAVRSLWLRARTAEQYASAMQREQETARALAVETERARIARELHDVLGHNVSVMMIQAGAARQVVNDSPQATQALLSVEAAGRQAIRELRHLLNLLGTTTDTDAADAHGEDLAPQPALGHLDALVARMVTAGQPVELTVRGAAQPIEPGVELAAYRVIQEGLTNALKYATGARTEVHVEYQLDALSVVVLDHGHQADGDIRDGSGRGLLGLRERVALYHGQFQAGRCPDGGYQVRARFPLDPREPQ